VLQGGGGRVREARGSDAAALCAELGTDEVGRFISPPPETVDGFERFLAWAERERAAGTVACFAVTRPEADTAVGLIQVRALDPGFGLAEWGFALGSAHWGTGLFMASAALVLRFTFTHLGVRRLEARAAVQNGRGNAVLRKLHAAQEGCLRGSLQRHNTTLDQFLWSILADEWMLDQALAERQLLSLTCRQGARHIRFLSH
jgi:RimJ/RimL family protein N-acetyltransferase